jgi:hypothetical protein
LAAIKAGVAPAALARPMQPIRIERVPANAADVARNGHANGRKNGQANGHANGNGKNRRGKSNGVVATILPEQVVPELAEVGGK